MKEFYLALSGVLFVATFSYVLGLMSYLIKEGKKEKKLRYKARISWNVLWLIVIAISVGCLIHVYLHYSGIGWLLFLALIFANVSWGMYGLGQNSRYRDGFEHWYRELMFTNIRDSIDDFDSPYPNNGEWADLD